MSENLTCARCGKTNSWVGYSADAGENRCANCLRVEQVVADAPPITDAQRATLIRIFRSTRGE